MRTKDEEQAQEVSRLMHALFGTTSNTASREVTFEDLTRRASNAQALPTEPGALSALRHRTTLSHKPQ